MSISCVTIIIVVPLLFKCSNIFIVLKFIILDDITGTYERTELSLRVPAYTTFISETPYVCNFVRYIPTSIQVDVDSDSVEVEGDKLLMDFNPDDNIIYSYIDDLDNKYLIIEYSVLNNSFSVFVHSNSCNITNSFDCIFNTFFNKVNPLSTISIIIE